MCQSPGRCLQHLPTTAYRLWSGDTAPAPGHGSQSGRPRGGPRTAGWAERDQLPSPLADFEQAWLELVHRSGSFRVRRIHAPAHVRGFVQRCRIFGQPTDQRAPAASSARGTRTQSPQAHPRDQGLRSRRSCSRELRFTSSRRSTKQDEREPGEMLHREVVGRHPLTSACSAAAASDGSCRCRRSRSARSAAEQVE